MNSINIKSLHHISFQRFWATLIGIREILTVCLELRQEILVESLLEQLASDIFSYSIRIEEFFHIYDTERYQLDDSAIKDNSVLPNFHLRVILAEFLQKVGVDLDSIGAPIKVGPSYGTHEVHVKLAVPQISGDEIHLVLVELQVGRIAYLRNELENH